MSGQISMQTLDPAMSKALKRNILNNNLKKKRQTKLLNFFFCRFLKSFLGSLLVACSHFGAYVCGTDIDYNTIHGVGK